MGAVKSIIVIIFSSAFLSECSSVKGAGTDMASVNSPTNLQTPPPYILLKDNLDEKDRLGWCIDTKGRGFSEQLHVHSCKPQGDDVLFSYDAISGQIRSVTYGNKCAQIVGEDPQVPFGLFDCDAGNPAQGFNYTAETSELKPRGQEDQCIVAGEVSRAAGPFMARDLMLAPCKDAEPTLKQWAVVSGE